MEYPLSLRVPSSTTPPPPSGISQLSVWGRERGCARAGLVPEATPCTTPSRVLLPAGRQRGTFKGSELREQRLWQAQWLHNGQRDLVGSRNPVPITASLGLKIPQVPSHHCTEPPMPTSSGLPVLPTVCPSPPPPDVIPAPFRGLLFEHQHSAKNQFT